MPGLVDLHLFVVTVLLNFLDLVATVTKSL
jgi:hypothetical protein